MRKDANLIPEIIKNPQLSSRARISEQNAILLHNIFNESNLSDRILNIFKTSQIEDFARELQNLLNIYFTDEDLISIEIDEINKSIYNPDRPLRILPPNDYATRDKSGFNFKIRYYLYSHNISRSNDIYVIILISDHCDDIITERLEKPAILRHINNNEIYHFECRSCHRRFRITPSLLDFC